MKRLATILLTSLLIGCGSTPPVSVKIPAIPAPTKFVKGDLVLVTSPDKKTKVQGVVIDVGPMAAWIDPITNQEFTSRAYRIEVMIDDKPQVGVAPELALTKLPKEDCPPPRKKK